MSKVANFLRNILKKKESRDLGEVDTEVMRATFKTNPASVNLATMANVGGGLEDSKRIEIEDRFKRSLDYVVENFDNNLNEIVNSRKYMKEIHKLSEMMNIECKSNKEVLMVISYTKVVMAFVNLLDSTLECSKLYLTSTYNPHSNHHQHNRKSDANQAKQYHSHRDHTIDYCKEANHLFYSVVYLISSATHSSVVFRKNFNEFGGTQLLIYYISNDDFLNSAAASVESDPYENYHILFLMRNIVNTLRNLSKTVYFDNFKVRLVLLSFIQVFKFHETHLLLAYLILIKISNDNEIETMPNHDVFIRKFMQLTQACVNTIEPTSAIMTTRVEIELDTGRIAPVCRIISNSCEFNIVELLDTINTLSVNDGAKYDLFVDYNINQMMKTTILNGNDVESEYAVRLLLQLSFDKNVRRILKEDLNLISMIKKIVSYQYPNKRLIRYSESLIWIIENNLKKLKNNSKTQIVLRTFSDGKTEVASETGDTPTKTARKSYIVVKSAESDDSDKEESKAEPPEVQTKSQAKSEKSNDSTNDLEEEEQQEDEIIIHKNQVFMSFDSASRELCLRVKNDLKNFGFNVWMNDEKFNNFALDETIDAIRSSECVILCITSNYKLNPACRLEAEYAMQIGKTVIPLIMQMQSNYFPDGWLGELIGSKVFIDLKRPSYKQSMESLIKRLRLVVTLEEEDAITVFDDNYFENEDTQIKPDVMISCHFKNRDFAKKIKKEIEKWGLIVWISVEKLPGMNVMSVDSAISNNECVLICVTREYEQSSSCRIEAELASESNKPIIPLIVQEGFDPHGCEWLSDILEGKDYVDFIAHPFEKSIKDLKRELSYQFDKETLRDNDDN